MASVVKDVSESRIALKRGRLVDRVYARVRALRSDACAWTSSDAHSSYTCEYISYVFTRSDQREETLCLTSQSRALALGKSAPDPVAFAVGERIFQAIKANVAVHAYAFGGIARTSTLGKEQIGILTTAQRRLLPVIADSPHALPPDRIDPVASTGM